MEFASNIFKQAQALSTTLSNRGLAFVRVRPLSTTLFAGAVGATAFAANNYLNQQWADRMLNKRNAEGKVCADGYLAQANQSLSSINNTLNTLIKHTPAVDEVKAVPATTDTLEVKAVPAKAAEYTVKESVTFTQLLAYLSKIEQGGVNQWDKCPSELRKELGPIHSARQEAIKAVKEKIATLKVAEIKAGLVEVAGDFIAELRKISGQDSEVAISVMQAIQQKLADTKTLDEAKANQELLKAALLGKVEDRENFKRTKGFTAVMPGLLSTKIGEEGKDTLQAYVGGELKQKLQSNVTDKINEADAANVVQSADRLILNKLIHALNHALQANTGTLAKVEELANYQDKPVSKQLYMAIFALAGVGVLVSFANRLPALQNVIKQYPWLA